MMNHYSQKISNNAPLDCQAACDKSPKQSLAKPQLGMAGLGMATAIILAIFLLTTQKLAQPLLLGLGLLFGFTLFHAQFGFTSAFRRLMAVGNGEALRAHMLMLAVAVSFFAPILAYQWSFFGGDVVGYVDPVGVSLFVGAFVFGIGMQLGNGCASGTLYAVGGGRSVMFVTLIFFIIGATLGAKHLPFWAALPAFEPFSLATSTSLGYGGAWALSLVIFGVIAWLTLQVEKNKNPPKMASLPTTHGLARVIRGSWPLWVGAVLLAVLNALTLMTRNEPWGVTSAFTLWGSKVAYALGVDVAGWGYWSGERATALTASVWGDATTALNVGIMIGAFVASAMAGLFKFSHITKGNLMASVIGGLMMGYGARLAFGCNVGAYFSGIASFSLHGYVWGVCAMAGTFFALFLRPLFGLSVPKSNDSFC